MSAVEFWNGKVHMNLCKYFSLAILIFIIDRISKIVALRWCADAACTINQYLSFEVTLNRGISWGMLHQTTDTTFVLVSFVITTITALLCWDAYRNYVRNKSIVGHVIIITGSVCNLIDRALYGGVIDFIILSYNRYSWPVFNVADMAIVCGVLILIFVDEK